MSKKLEILKFKITAINNAAPIDKTEFSKIISKIDLSKNFVAKLGVDDSSKVVIEVVREIENDIKKVHSSKDFIYIDENYLPKYDTDIYEYGIPNEVEYYIQDIIKQFNKLLVEYEILQEVYNKHIYT